MSLADAGEFHPELAESALTLVPLILVASALDAKIVPRTRRALLRKRAALRPGESQAGVRVLQALATLWGVGMAGAAVAVIVLSLTALLWRTPDHDTWIFWLSIAVTFGLGFSITRNIIVSFWPRLPRTDERAPATRADRAA